MIHGILRAHAGTVAACCGLLGAALFGWAFLEEIGYRLHHAHGHSLSEPILSLAAGGFLVGVGLLVVGNRVERADVDG